MERVRLVDGDARLVGSRCASCGHRTFPRRDRCPACRAPGAMDEALLGPEGTVESSTVLHVATDESEAPYTLGLVRLDDGPTLLSRILGADARVRLLADPEQHSFWFAPAADAAAAAPPHAA